MDRVLRVLRVCKQQIFAYTFFICINVCRIPLPRKPRRRVEQRQMAALAQNNKSSNCPGIFYLIYKSLLSFISSSYITESLRNDSPEEERVTNEITPSVLMGHVACQLYIWNNQKWSATAAQSRPAALREQRWLWCAALLHLQVFQRSVKWQVTLFMNEIHCSTTNHKKCTR